MKFFDREVTRVWEGITHNLPYRFRVEVGNDIWHGAFNGYMNNVYFNSGPGAFKTSNFIEWSGNDPDEINPIEEDDYEEEPVLLDVSN